MKPRGILTLVTLLAWMGLFAAPQATQASRLPIRPLEPEFVNPPQWDPEVPDGGQPAGTIQGDSPTHEVASTWTQRLLRFLRLVRLAGVIR
jgi:hypothetical protein